MKSSQFDKLFDCIVQHFWCYFFFLVFPLTYTKYQKSCKYVCRHGRHIHWAHCDCFVCVCVCNIEKNVLLGRRIDYSVRMFYRCFFNTDFFKVNAIVPNGLVSIRCLNVLLTYSLRKRKYFRRKTFSNSYGSVSSKVNFYQKPSKYRI